MISVRARACCAGILPLFCVHYGQNLHYKNPYEKSTILLVKYLTITVEMIWEMLYNHTSGIFYFL